MVDLVLKSLYIAIGFTIQGNQLPQLRADEVNLNATRALDEAKCKMAKYLTTHGKSLFSCHCEAIDCHCKIIVFEAFLYRGNRGYSIVGA